ncbi:helix-turn-helix transcriptional regulator [Neobacillus sedimentimangrovi]|uniref:helix-turn-helix transcriptional regulator n=1 Tax=Neobacillus sedimentimangrovi TaxID=2699460 RepID=UPI001F1C6D1D|nr:DNA-binding response regulator [Neobacillus sedimentimangrovi]
MTQIMTYTKKQISVILKDYHWMLNSIKLLRESMAEAGEKIVRPYENSDMPKPKGSTSDPVYQEYIRREKRWKKIFEYEKKVRVIQERMHKITDDRELEVLHWLLEGKSFRWISLHMGLSHTHISRLRESIIEQMADTNVPNVTEVTN